MFSRRAALVLGLIAASLVATGCHSPGGGLLPSSFGTFVYPSTETMSKSITMVDLRTNQPFFVQVIPPGQQLVIQFLEGGGDDGVRTPDRMIYALEPLGSRSGTLNNQITVPPAAARRIDVEVSQTPLFREATPDEQYRTDTPATRPDYWSAQGGQRPAQGMRYDE